VANEIPYSGVVDISAEDLTATYLGLIAIADNYEPGSLGEASLIEAQRLTEVEMRAQHGDEAWAAMRTAAGRD